MHRPSVVPEIRDLPPTPDGWAQYQTTGRACVVCTCGVTTGFIPTLDAHPIYREHAARAPSRRITAPSQSRRTRR